MQRNFIYEALVLSVRKTGENNRSVSLLSQENGIETAVLYGGPKSKMKGLVLPYNRGRIYIYKDNTKPAKITDFDVTNFHPSFRENLFKSWAAAVAAETVIKSSCAGSPQEAWTLLNGFLDGLEISDERTGRLGLIRFLWRYLETSGVQPATKHCSLCGRPLFSAGKNEENIVLCEADSASSSAFYDPSENGFLCSDCAGQSSTLFELSSEALKYLNAVTELSAREVRSIVVSADAVNQMKQFVFYMTEWSLNQKLSSLESGIGIL